MCLRGACITESLDMAEHITTDAASETFVFRCQEELNVKLVNMLDEY